MSPKVLIMAGGTGGHIFPALAVAQQLATNGWHVIWLGNKKGMEARYILEHDFITPVWVQIGPLRGKRLMAKIIGLWSAIRALWHTWQIMRHHRPHVVLGMGGYVTGPGGLSAWLTRIPLVIHEQNAKPGLTNRLLASVAKTVLSGFPKALPRALFVGNPLRAPFYQFDDVATRYQARQGPLRLLVLGGSQGALALNKLVPQALALLPVEQCPIIYHQTGAQWLDHTVKQYKAAQVEAECVAFIDNMLDVYRSADIVLCRAGALTVAELTASGVASVLVPFPFAVDDHQTANARFLADKGGALLLPQAQLTPETLAATLQKLTRPQLQTMAQAARSQAHAEATQTICDACTALLPKAQV